MVLEYIMHKNSLGKHHTLIATLSDLMGTGAVNAAAVATHPSKIVRRIAQDYKILLNPETNPHKTEQTGAAQDWTNRTLISQ